MWLPKIHTDDTKNDQQQFYGFKRVFYKLFIAELKK